MRVRELLGINLDELREAYETELRRSEVRERWAAGGLGDDERRVLLGEALGHIDVQLGLVRDRMDHLQQFEAELRDKRATVAAKLDALTGAPDRSPSD